jgi:hypothetical protein
MFEPARLHLDSTSPAINKTETTMQPAFRFFANSNTQSPLAVEANFARQSREKGRMIEAINRSIGEGSSKTDDDHRPMIAIGGNGIVGFA